MVGKKVGRCKQNFLGIGKIDDNAKSGDLDDCGSSGSIDDDDEDEDDDDVTEEDDISRGGGGGCVFCFFFVEIISL